MEECVGDGWVIGPEEGCREERKTINVKVCVGGGSRRTSQLAPTPP